MRFRQDRLDCSEDWLAFHHHPLPAPVRQIVRGAMLSLGPVPHIVVAKIHQSTFLRLAQDALGEGILGNADPDELIDAQLPSVVAWQRATRQYLIYR